MIWGLQKTSLYFLAVAAAFGVLITGAPALKAQGLTEAQYQRLKRELKEELAQDSDVDLKVKWKGAPKLSSRDGKSSFKVRGRLMGDFDSIDQDETITGEKDINGVELRRARLGVEGHLWYDWKYKFEVDFAGDRSRIKDAYIAYANWWNNIAMSEIIVGNFKVANSLEEMTSSRFITFMERAAFIEAFDFQRRIGVGAWLGDDHWSFQTGYYGATANDQDTWFDDQTSYSVRGTVAPINNDSTVVHLGGSYRHRNAGTLEDTGAAELYRYRARGADLHLADRFIATPRIGESDDMFVLEGAVVWNRFSVQGEYAQIDVDVPSTIAMVSPEYNGYYVEASVFLTDDMRNYSAKTGEFKRVKVKNPVFNGSGGWGALQLAGRYDVLDLSGGAAPINNSIAPLAVTCTDCGKQSTWLIALNWWMTDYTALKFNVTQSEISGPGANNGATISGFGTRFQIDW